MIVVVELYNHFDDDHDQNDFLLKKTNFRYKNLNIKSYFYNMIVTVVVVVHYDNIVVHLDVVESVVMIEIVVDN